MIWYFSFVNRKIKSADYIKSQFYIIILCIGRANQTVANQILKMIISNHKKSIYNLGEDLYSNL